MSCKPEHCDFAFCCKARFDEPECRKRLLQQRVNRDVTADLMKFIARSFINNLGREDYDDGIIAG